MALTLALALILTRCECDFTETRFEHCEANEGGGVAWSGQP